MNCARRGCYGYLELDVGCPALLARPAIHVRSEARIQVGAWVSRSCSQPRFPRHRPADGPRQPVRLLSVRGHWTVRQLRLAHRQRPLHGNRPAINLAEFCDLDSHATTRARSDPPRRRTVLLPKLHYLKVTGTALHRPAMRTVRALLTPRIDLDQGMIMIRDEFQRKIARTAVAISHTTDSPAKTTVVYCMLAPWP